MGEKRVSSFYISSDFNPSGAGRKSKPQNGQHDLRFMLPMAIKCNHCGEYMFAGTKVNSRKELCYGEFYLGIAVYRIYLHCKSCYSEITIKTDPQNSDYLVEKGATRHFEPFREIQKKMVEEEKEKHSGSAIYQVEESAVDQKREMNQQDELMRLEMRSLRRKKPRISDIRRIHREESVLNSNLSTEDKIKINEFEGKKEEEFIEKSSKIMHIHGFGDNRWKKTSLLIDDSDD